MTENAEEGDSAEQKEQPSDGSEPSYEESEESQRKEEEAAAAVQRAFRRYAVRKRRDNEAAKRLQRTWRRKLKQNMSDAQLRSMRKWHVVATALVCSAGAAAAQLTEQWLRELDGLGTAASPRSKRQRLRQRRREERMGTRRQTAFHGHSARQDEARSKRQFQSVQRLPTISGGDEWTVSHSPITPSRIPLATPVPSCAASVGSCGAAVRGETATGSPAPSPAASRQESAPTERQAQPPSRSEEHSHGAPDSPLVAAATQPLVPEVYVPLRRRPVTAPQKRRRGNHMHLAPTRLREKAPLQVDVMMPPPLSPPPPVTPIRRARPKQKIPDIQEVLAAVPHFHALSSSDAVDIETWGTSLLEGFNMPVSAEADRRSSLLGPPKTMRRVSQRVRKASSVSGLAKSPRGRSGSTRSPSKSFFGGQGADQGSTLFQYGGTVRSSFFGGASSQAALSPPKPLSGGNSSLVFSVPMLTSQVWHVPRSTSHTRLSGSSGGARSRSSRISASPLRHNSTRPTLRTESTPSPPPKKNSPKLRGRGTRFRYSLAERRWWRRDGKGVARKASRAKEVQLDSCSSGLPVYDDYLQVLNATAQRMHDE